MTLFTDAFCHLNVLERLKGKFLFKFYFSSKAQPFPLEDSKSFLDSNYLSAPPHGTMTDSLSPDFNLRVLLCVEENTQKDYVSSNCPSEKLLSSKKSILNVHKFV